MSREVNCPKCGRSVKAPSSAPSVAKVRCPLCGSVYTLKTALEWSPPELQIVEPWPTLHGDETLTADSLAETIPAPIAPPKMTKEHASTTSPAGSTEPLSKSLDEAAAILGQTISEGDSLSDTVEFLAQPQSSGSAASSPSPPELPLDETIDWSSPATAPPVKETKRVASEEPLEFDLSTRDDFATESEELSLGDSLNFADAPTGEADALGIVGDEVEPESAFDFEQEPTQAVNKVPGKTSAASPSGFDPAATAIGAVGKVASAKKRQREPSLVTTIVASILGAAMAVPLASFILLWVSGIGLDFLGLHKYLPAVLVPENVRRELALRPDPPGARTPSDTTASSLSTANSDSSADATDRGPTNDNESGDAVVDAMDDDAASITDLTVDRDADTTEATSPTTTDSSSLARPKADTSDVATAVNDAVDDAGDEPEMDTDPPRRSSSILDDLVRDSGGTISDDDMASAEDDVETPTKSPRVATRTTTSSDGPLTDDDSIDGLADDVMPPDDSSSEISDLLADSNPRGEPAESDANDVVAISDLMRDADARHDRLIDREPANDVVDDDVRDLRDRLPDVDDRIDEADPTDALADRDAMDDQDIADQEMADQVATDIDDVPESDDLESASEPVGLKSAVEYHPDRVAAAVKQAKSLAAELKTSPGAGKEAAKLRSDYYRKLYELAESANFSAVERAASGDERASTISFIRAIASTEKEMNALGNAADKWLDLAPAKRRNQRGVMLVGEVKSVRPAGRLFATSIALTGGKKTVEFVSPSKVEVAPGMSAAVLGVIVEHPQEDISGYMGDDSLVVWSHLVVPMK